MKLQIIVDQTKYVMLDRNVPQRRARLGDPAFVHKIGGLTDKAVPYPSSDYFSFIKSPQSTPNTNTSPARPIEMFEITVKYSLGRFRGMCSGRFRSHQASIKYILVRTPRPETALINVAVRQIPQS